MLKNGMKYLEFIDANRDGDGTATSAASFLVIHVPIPTPQRKTNYPVLMMTLPSILQSVYSSMGK